MRLFTFKAFFVSLIALLLFTPLALLAQVSHGGTPLLSNFLHGNGKRDIARYVLDNTDVSELVREDSLLKSRKDIPYRFGKELPVAINMNTHGTWFQLQGGKVWRAVVGSKGALSINLVFSKFRLTEGGKLFIVTPDGNKWIGALNFENNLPENVLGTMPLPGDEVVIEYFVPDGVKDKGELEVGTVVHGYKNVFAFGESGTCQININCAVANDWQTIKRSVVVMLNGGAFCTGALINNVLNDGTPYVLTANHCYSNNVASWSVAFNYESTDCVSRDASLSNSVSGMRLRAKSGRSDFCLLQLSSKPPLSYRPYYAGWDMSGTAPTNGACIHHPNGDIKKFTPFSTTGSTATYSGATCWNVDWDLSACTEPGSSGSPLFNESKRIIGQLYGGPSACGSVSTDMNDFYGKFSVSWQTTTAPTTANQLKSWLDPTNTGVTTINGFDPNCIIEVKTMPLAYLFDTSRAIPNNFISGDASSLGWNFVSGLSSRSASGNCIKAIGNANLTAPRGKRQIVELPNLSINIASASYLYYDFASAYKGLGFEDTLQVFYSLNCGTNYNLLGEKSGLAFDNVRGRTFPTGFVPISTDWLTDSILLPAGFFIGNSVRFRFVFKKGNGYDFYLDNISLKKRALPIQRIGINVANYGCAGSSILAQNTSDSSGLYYTWTVNGQVVANRVDRRSIPLILLPGLNIITLMGTNEDGDMTASTSVWGVAAKVKSFPELEVFQDSSLITRGYEVKKNSIGMTSWRVSNVVQGQMLYKNFLIVDNLTTNNQGAGDTLVIPFVDWRGVGIYKPRLTFKYAYKYDISAGTGSKDSLLLILTKNCGGSSKVIWKKGGAELATVAVSQGLFLPQWGDFNRVFIDLNDSLFKNSSLLEIYSKPQFSLVSKSGNGSFVFIDSVSIDTMFSCPKLPSVEALVFCSNRQLQAIVKNPKEGVVYNWTDLNTGLKYVGTEIQVPNSWPNVQRYNFSVSAFNNSCFSDLVTLNGAIVLAPAAYTIEGEYEENSNNVSSFSLRYLGRERQIKWFCDSVPLSTNLSDSAIIVPKKEGNYFVRVFGQSGCFDDSKGFEYRFPSGFGVKVLGNPFVDELNLEISNGNAGEMAYDIYDVLGKKIASSSITLSKGVFKVKLPEFSGLESGLYSIRFKGDYVVKVVKR